MSQSGGTTPGLPPVTFFSGKFLNNGSALPIELSDSSDLSIPTTPLDFSGYNTLSIFTTVSSLGGNTFSIILVAIDPETGVAVASNLGDVTLVSDTTDDDYAATLYLPSYYASLSGLVMPFYLHKLKLVNAGGHGSISFDALKLWLTNA